VVIVETRGFTRRIDDLFSPEEYRLLQLALVARPDAGKIIRARVVSGSSAGRWAGGGSAAGHGSSTSGIRRATNFWCCSPLPRTKRMTWRSSRDALCAESWKRSTH